MKIKFSPEFEKQLEKISKSNIQLAKKAKKQLSLFSQNPVYPSLRNHKLSGMTGLWSISVTESIRAIYLIQADTAYFIDIGTHEEVYRK